MSDAKFSKTVLLVDVHNWYITGMKKFPEQVVNYSEICGYGFGQKIAFGRQSEDKVATFAKLLRNLRFDVRFGGSPYNIEMALEAAQLIERGAVERLVIGSSYFETIHIHEYAHRRGIETAVMGFSIPEAFSRFSDVIELDETVMMEAANDVPSERPFGVVTAA